MNDSPNVPEHANVLVPAPVFYIAALLLSYVTHKFIPAPVSSSGVAKTIGIILVVLSVPIVLASVAELKKAGTAFDARKTTTALVTGGIYRFSRNPTYLSMTMLFFGIALLINSWFVVVAITMATIIMQWAVIMREEEYLTAVFGDEYLSYAAKVRRWL